MTSNSAPERFEPGKYTYSHAFRDAAELRASGEYAGVSFLELLNATHAAGMTLAHGASWAEKKAKHEAEAAARVAETDRKFDEMVRRADARGERLEAATEEGREALRLARARNRRRANQGGDR
ncbi:hypothetical protein [Methylosinus sp. PW1]|uniref:hypothetical protein n=1 Tax=Methylosinus sp. PW1 TaxID=107636 RepID=UPI000565B8E6|nr:hypothetical protein [Methylosinus sp. PW1]